MPLSDKDKLEIGKRWQAIVPLIGPTDRPALAMALRLAAVRYEDDARLSVPERSKLLLMEQCEWCRAIADMVDIP